MCRCFVFYRHNHDLLSISFRPVYGLLLTDTYLPHSSASLSYVLRPESPRPDDLSLRVLGVTAFASGSAASAVNGVRETAGTAGTAVVAIGVGARVPLTALCGDWRAGAASAAANPCEGLPGCSGTRVHASWRRHSHIADPPAQACPHKLQILRTGQVRNNACKVLARLRHARCRLPLEARDPQRRLAQE